MESSPQPSKEFQFAETVSFKKSNARIMGVGAHTSLKYLVLPFKTSSSGGISIWERDDAENSYF